MFRSLKGMTDVLPAESERWLKVEEHLRRILVPFGYREIRTPLLEETDLFARSIGTSTDVVEKEMFSFTDQGGTSISLRPEGTASVIRAYLEHHMGHGNDLVKVYYLGPMFRHERPQKGRFRQFHSIGAEAIGSAQPLVDVEMLELLWTVLSEFKVPSPLLEVNSVGDDACRPAYREKLRTYLRSHSADLSETVRNRIETNPMRAFDSKSETDQAIVKKAPLMIDSLCAACRDHFTEVTSGLKSLRIPFETNPAIVRGLDYYTRTAFEISATGLGSQNAVAGGGRYDGLAKELGGDAVPATGFGLGIERLLLTSPLYAEPAATPRVSFLPLDPKAKETALRLAHELRSLALKNGAEVIAEVDFEMTSLKSGLRKADKNGSMYAVLIGETEIGKQAATVKNLKGGSQDEISFERLSAEILNCLRGN